MLSMEKMLGYLMTAVLALLSWNVYTTQQLSVTVAVIEERTQGFNNGLLEQRIGRLEEWNQNMTERIRFLEQQERKNGKTTNP